MAGRQHRRFSSGPHASTAPPPRVITVSVTARAPVIARARNEARRLGDLLESHTAPSLYTATAQTESLVAELVNGFDSTGAANRAMRMEGSWRVFYAPHIFRLSQWFGPTARFEPLEYDLGEKGRFSSHVRYRGVFGGLVGEGWLSAAGTIAPVDDATLEIEFTSFWVDNNGSALRRELPADGGTAWDRLVTGVGRLGFFKPLAVFPVRYLEQGGTGSMSVFRFPPLESDIAIIKTE